MRGTCNGPLDAIATLFMAPGLPLQPFTLLDDGAPRPGLRQADASAIDILRLPPLLLPAPDPDGSARAIRARGLFVRRGQESQCKYGCWSSPPWRRCWPSCRARCAQQSVDAVSVTGVVRDATGGAIAAANVELRSLARNEANARRTDAAGRFAFLSVPPGDYTLRVAANGFTPSVSNLRLLVGQAVEIPIALALARRDGQRRGHRRDAAGRGAPYAGRAHRPAGGDRHAAAERPQLPGPGAAGSRGLAHGAAQHRAVRGDVGGARHGHLHQRAAQSEQHVRGGRPIGQRRRRGAGGHLFRPGRDPRVPGDHVRRARDLRPRRIGRSEHRDAVRRAGPPRPRLRLRPRRLAGRTEPAGDTRRSAVAVAIRRQPVGADSRAIGPSILRTSSEPTSSAPAS